MNNIRYGIFFRPDPATCWAVTQVLFAVKQQFGLVAGSAFAPHATLIGNLQSAVGEEELVGILDGVFADIRPFPVYNHGIKDFAYRVNNDVMNEGPNQDLARIATAVKDAVQPIHVTHTDYLAPNVQDYTFNAHLSLASFDLGLDPRLKPEVSEFIEGLPIAPPVSFVLRWYTLFELTSSDWNGRWWEDQTWRHVKSWEAR